jgi:cell division transport system ATP-binding protein
MGLDTIIDFKDVSIYQGTNLILSEMNFHIDKGEFVYLVGKVGSGKTSIIKTIDAELPLQKGEATVAGYNLATIKNRQVPLLRRKLGIVFQDFQLLIDRSVYDNLVFVLHATGWKNKKQIADRINNVLEKVGLGYKGYKLPHQLSGGEQQRVVIARALLNEPDIIIADEPTGNLDPETSVEIVELLLDISRNGRAVIMATHNQSILKRFAARTLKCEKGRINEIDNGTEIDFTTLLE